MGNGKKTSNGEGGTRPGADIAALLSNGDFLRVWGVGAVLGIVRWLETLAVGIFIIDLTGSVVAVAIIGFLRMLPLLLLGALAGTLAGRFSRRSLLLVSVSVTGLLSLILGLLALADVIAVWQIAMGSFFTGILWMTDFPIRRTIMADIAGRARTGAAMSIESTTIHVTRLLGAGLGGLLVGSVGLEGTYLIGAAMFVLIIVLLRGIKYTDAPASGFHGNLLADTFGGLRAIASERLLVAVLCVTVTFNFFGFAYTSMVPVIGRTALHIDAFAIGLLVSAEAGASLVASLVFAALAPRRRLGVIYVFSVFSFMGGVLIFALSPSYWLCLAIMGVTGLAWGCFSVTQSTLVLLVSKPALKARAMGALAICIGLAPLGMLHLGWLAEHLGAPAAVAISAIEGAVAVVAVMVLFPRILKPDLPATKD
ncbi:MAG: MFS transporter [Rhodospirillales bacterium]|nr:MFS transporter [Rhodospirillales bacterium]